MTAPTVQLTLGWYARQPYTVDDRREQLLARRDQLAQEIDLTRFRIEMMAHEQRQIGQELVTMERRDGAEVW